MTEPQTWVMIGVFTTIMLGGMTLMTTLITRSTTAAVDGLRAEMNARFDTVDQRMDHLDRDVTFLMHRAWGEPTTE